MLKIEIATDNAAFSENPQDEVAWILHGEAFHPGESGILRDSNGNTVGRWEWSVDVREIA